MLWLLLACDQAPPPTLIGGFDPLQSATHYCEGRAQCEGTDSESIEVCLQGFEDATDRAIESGCELQDANLTACLSDNATCSGSTFSPGSSCTDQYDAYYSCLDSAAGE